MAATSGVGIVAKRGSPSTPSRFVLISGYHDYRTKRRANLHFIADELAKLGSVFFLSLRFSRLTRFAVDPRRDLWQRANRVETVGGVRCFLWRTAIHACRLPRRAAVIERALFGIFGSYLPRAVRPALQAADTIFIESGVAVTYLPLLRRLNPAAEIIYFAADALDAIRQAESVKQALRNNAPLIDRAILPSPFLREDVPAGIPGHIVPHGIDKTQFATIGASPYCAGSRNAVSVGSMLFDPGFVQVAAVQRPDVTFHIIGSGYAGAAPPNVNYLPEMPFAETLPFIKHADFAVAAYGAGAAPYLRHTSMKLMQYGFLGIPAVCPSIIAGDVPGRFGYAAGDAASIGIAMAGALGVRDLTPLRQLGWDEVASRWIAPHRFADVELMCTKRSGSVPSRPDPATEGHFQYRSQT